jgi:hypothetical protein
VLIGCPHRIIGLDVNMLLTGKSRLQLFEKVLICIVNVVFENDVERDFLFCESQEVVFEGLIGDFVVS